MHTINNTGIELINGEKLMCTRRRKAAVKEFKRFGKREMFSGFDRDNIPKTLKNIRSITLYLTPYLSHSPTSK